MREKTQRNFCYYHSVITDAFLPEGERRLGLDFLWLKASDQAPGAHLLAQYQWEQIGFKYSRTNTRISECVANLGEHSLKGCQWKRRNWAVKLLEPESFSKLSKRISHW
ncbi:hypothetical protein D9M68_927740 [compost metagenome]